MGKKSASRNQEIKDQVEPAEAKTEENKQASIICGLVMPISEIEGCSAEHWVEVRDIIEEALAAIDIKTSLVSDGDEVGIIQERIVQNLYDRPIVVCDVSCKNPNVMFELGLRLAFDMPTIILKDDMTNYTFDINVVEHLGYPRDLNYWSIQKFKKLLARKVKATLQKKDEDDEYSPFLKAFNKKRVADIETKDVTSVEFIMDELREMNQKIDSINRDNRKKDRFPSTEKRKQIQFPSISSPLNRDDLIKVSYDGIIQMMSIYDFIDLAQKVKKNVRIDESGIARMVNPE